MNFEEKLKEIIEKASLDFQNKCHDLTITEVMILEDIIRQSLSDYKKELGEEIEKFDWYGREQMGAKEYHGFILSLLQKDKETEK